MRDRQAAGWRHPERHVARRSEPRTPAELANLLTLDALIRTYRLDADELEDLMLWIRGPYRGDSPASHGRLRRLGRLIAGHMRGAPGRERVTSDRPDA